MMNLGTAEIIRADARRLPLEDASVDLIVTSPPYFALRSYQDGGEHYEGQIGSEPTPAEFVDALLEVTRECVRVLKPSGSLWVNLGDKYSQRVATRPSSHQDGLFPDREDLPKDWKRDKALGLTRMPYQNVTDPASGRFVPEKSLMGLPWRYAIRCIDELGLILRAEVIWSKPNGLPESVTDRVRRSHEQWFHLTLEPRYFSAVDEIRESYDPKSITRIAAGFNPTKRDAVGVERNGMMRARGAGESTEGYNPNPLGKLPGSVWTVPTEPLKVPAELGVDHFAAFPSEWPKRLIQGWSPSGVCTACGEGRRPVVEKDRRNTRPMALKMAHQAAHDLTGEPDGRDFARGETDATITGYACACPEPAAPTTPAVVLDPFGGTGTTAMVAKALGRRGISVDMSADYCRLAEWRTNDLGQLAKVRGEAKPTPVAEDQGDIFAALDGEAS